MTVEGDRPTAVGEAGTSTLSLPLEVEDLVSGDGSLNGGFGDAGLSTILGDWRLRGRAVDL